MVEFGISRNALLVSGMEEALCSLGRVSLEVDARIFEQRTDATNSESESRVSDYFWRAITVAEVLKMKAT